MKLIDADVIIKATQHVMEEISGKEGIQNDVKVMVCESILELVEDFPEHDPWIYDRLPDEHESVFSKLRGTARWTEGMFDKSSDEVQVIVERKDGSRYVTTSHTCDGEWKFEFVFGIRRVVAWCPFQKIVGGN